MVDGDVVGSMVALPPQLLLNTQIPACLWFLTKERRDMDETDGARFCLSTPVSWDV